MKMIRGLMVFTSETPAAFMAVSSDFSPRLPKVIRLASRMARGSAIGTMLTAA